MSKVYVGDVGTEIILDCKEDISAATVSDILAKKPNGVVVTWIGTVISLTKIKYATVASDLDMAGTWKLQVKVTVAGWSGLGETVDLKVFGAFK